MPENTAERKVSHQIATAIIHRQDGTCRRILKQRSETIDGKDVVTVLMDKFYLPGTFVDNDGVILKGPGECKRWTQAYSFKELAEIKAANIKAKMARVFS